MFDHWISRDWSNKHVAYSTVDDRTEYIEIYIMVFSYLLALGRVKSRSGTIRA